MATLSTTLSKAPANRYSYTGGSNYGVPKQSNPYRRLGASVSSPSSGGQGLFAALSQQQQFQRPLPSTQFQTQYNFDPVLSKLSALGEMSIANARSEAANLKKQALIDAGDAGFAQEIGADPNTVQAAGGNTLSTRANLTRDFQQRSRDMDEALNQQNLFYGGERIRQMGELERGRASAETDFLAQLRNLVRGIDDQMLMAEQMEQERLLEEALARASATSPAPGGTAPPAPIVDGPIAPMPSDWISAGEMPPPDPITSSVSGLSLLPPALAPAGPAWMGAPSVNNIYSLSPEDEALSQFLASPTIRMMMG